MHLPPPVAALLTIAFIVFLFRRDSSEKSDVSSALWLPLIWMLITCSRAVSAWLNIFGLPVSGAASVEEGSPVDAGFYLALAAAGFCVLTKRKVHLTEIIRNDGWIIGLILFSFISIAWSDFPFITLKRWIKILGAPIMALIVVTERNPEEALTLLLKRSAYVIVPVSVLFIKYYPEWGAYYDPFSGVRMNRGVAGGKNSLGADCLILGFFFCWYFLQIWRSERNTRRRNELLVTAGFLLMIAWLFRRAHSSTAVITLLVALMVVVFVGFRSVNKRFIGTYMVTGLLLIAVAELVFGISGELSEALGKGSSLSGRTVLWERLLALHTNPIFGTGFESFWLGDRPQKLEGIFYFIPNEAHNGYLEMYLDLGLMGIFIVIGMFVATYRKIRLKLFQDFEWGRYKLGMLAAIILYNCTEAAMKTYHPLWFVFFLIAMDYPRSHPAAEEPSGETATSEESKELAYAGEEF
jgi:exopolysaccharide production protein ExoQ